MKTFTFEIRVLCSVEVEAETAEKALREIVHEFDGHLITWPIEGTLDGNFPPILHQIDGADIERVEMPVDKLPKVGAHCDCWDLEQPCCHCDSSDDDGDCHGDSDVKPCKRVERCFLEEIGEGFEGKIWETACENEITAKSAPANCPHCKRPTEVVPGCRRCQSTEHTTSYHDAKESGAAPNAVPIKALSGAEFKQRILGKLTGAEP